MPNPGCMRHLTILVLALGLVAPPGAVPAVGAPSVLPDCRGKPIVRPSKVVLTCAYYGVSVLTHLSHTRGSGHRLIHRARRAP